MSPQFYNVLHITGVILVFLAYGLLIARGALRSDDPGVRKLGGIASGVGLLLILVSGFGLLAKFSYGFPAWVIAKIVIWVVLGGMITALNRAPHLSRLWFWVIFLLGLLAVLSAYLRPTF